MAVEEILHARLAIVGSGPGGLTAAIYAGRAGLQPVVFAGVDTQSELMLTTDVENYPGFEKIKGPELLENYLEQAISSGAQILYEDVSKIDVEERPFKVTHGYDNEIMTCDSIIFATGSIAQRLNVPGEEKYWMHGVSVCAVCDSMMARGKTTVVVGGGDVACEEASYLANIAEKVYLVLRRDQFRASKPMVDRVLRQPHIEILYNSVVHEIEGEERVKRVIIQNVKSGELSSLDATSLFWCVGHIPQTGLLKGQVEMNENGYIITKPDTENTSVPGLFAAGDCCDWVYRQAVVAAGSGAKAALECERWLEDQQ